MEGSQPSTSGKGSSSDVKLAGWSRQQCRRAAESLLTYLGKRKESSNALFDDEEVLYMQLALKKMPLQSRKDKPIALRLPHALFTTEGAEICLLVKDQQGKGGKEAKKRLQRFEKMGGVSKVIGVHKLRTKYESHEAKRELCKSFDLFLADDRVLPMLPKLIGKSFFKKKKQPIPVKLAAKDFPAQVRHACRCTYMFKNSGTCINIKIGLGSLSAKQVEENVCAALVQAVENIPKKWSAVQGVFLKTAESVALPVWQTLPDAPQKIAPDGAAVSVEPSAPPAPAAPAQAKAGGKKQALDAKPIISKAAQQKGTSLAGSKGKKVGAKGLKKMR